MKNNTLTAVLVAALIAALFSLSPSPAIPNSTDLSQGWYALPPVSQEQLAPVVGCLVEAGLPQPTLHTEPLLMPGMVTKNGNVIGHDPKAPTYAPTVLVWSRNGQQESTAAVLTYFSPAVTWIEMAKKFNLPQERFLQVNECVDKIKRPRLISVQSPIGPPISACKNCFSTAGGDVDRFKGGATFTDATGTYLKHEGMLSLFTRSWWEKVR